MSDQAIEQPQAELHVGDTTPAAAAVGKKEPYLNKYFKACIKMEVSDLHLKAGKPAHVRQKGDLRAMTGGPLTDEQIRNGIFELLRPDQIEMYKAKGAIDFAYDVAGQEQGSTDRFRVNAFQQRGKMSVAARRVTSKIRKLEELYVPAAVAKCTEFNQGLVLLAGITGSGKSTTIAALIDYINERYPVHIVTVEDPIEYLFTDKKAVINQREIGIDCNNFSDALKYLMREDPDVALVGEMRDIETFSAAIHAAETGHLVFGTIHASGAAQTISRILDLFPESERSAVRLALQFNLKAIVGQKLIPSVRPEIPVVPVCEIMFMNPAISKLIAEERDQEITAVIRSSYDAGMQDFNEHLRQLVEDGYIDHATAYAAAPNADELKMALKGIRTGQSSILG